MFKNLFRPFQDILLKRGLCPGCTMPLAKAPKKTTLRDDKLMVECKCKRRFIFDQKTGNYRRMSLLEESEYLSKPKK